MRKIVGSGSIGSDKYFANFGQVSYVFLPQHPLSLTKIKLLLKKKQGVIFDFDGLLADSEPYHYLAYNEVFQRYGHSLDKDEYWVEWTSKGKGIAGEIERHNLDSGMSTQFNYVNKNSRCIHDIVKMETFDYFQRLLKVIELFKTCHPVAIASGSWKHDIRCYSQEC